jgi:hypothetical protein
MKALTAFCIIAFILLVSCTRDHADLLVPTGLTCDTLHVSYRSCIKPIFVTHCYDCHSDSVSQGGSLGFDVENFTTLKTYLTYYYHNDSIYGSKFMRAISHQQGVLVMPPSYQMPDSSIALIKYWIELGAPEN